MLNVSKFRLVSVCSIVDTEVKSVQIKTFSWTHFFWLIPVHIWDYEGTAVSFVKLCSYTFSQLTRKYHQYLSVHKHSDSSLEWIHSGQLGSSMGQSPTRINAHTYDRKKYFSLWNVGRRNFRTCRWILTKPTNCKMQETAAADVILASKSSVDQSYVWMII